LARRTFDFIGESLESHAAARISVTLDHIARSSHGSITGPIWIAGDEAGVAFPEVEWSDFPIALLAAWIPALRRLSARGDAAECHFMDGPYRFTVIASTADDWRVACFEARETFGASNAVTEWRTAPAAFLESAVSAATALLGYCDARQWWSDETEQLRAALGFRDPERAS
jgi:hypothetical protein